MKIYLLGFDGTTFRDKRYIEKHPLIRSGHVGLQFEDDPRIWGFSPSPAAEKAAGSIEALINQLKNHLRQPGIIQDDTLVFHEAHSMYRDGEPLTEVLILTYEVSAADFYRIKQTLLEWYNTKKEFWYNFPTWEGTFNQDEYNCATFPQVLGLPLPSENGLLETYLRLMKDEKGATPWQPNSKS